MLEVTRRAVLAVIFSVSAVSAHIAIGAETNAVAQPKTDEVQALKAISYGAANGKDLLMDAFLPAERFARPRPAVIWIHGGGWEGGSRNAPYILAIGKRTAEAGYAFFTIDYRLVQRPKDGKPAQNGYPAAVDDCQRAVRWIRHNADKYGIDPKRIAAIGDSAGGHLVSLLGTTDTLHNDDKTLASYSSRVTSVINLYGPGDLTQEFPATNVFGASARAMVENFTGKDLEQRKAASPVFHLDEKTVPFLIFQGAADPLVPVQLTREFNDALKKAKCDVTYVEFEGEGHGIAKPENQMIFGVKVLEFLARTLK